MRKVHFYKAKSRIGIINPPLGQKGLNIGVEDAPDAILTKEFLSHFNCVVSEYNFSKPENIDKNKYFDFIYREYGSCAHFINKTLKHDETQVVIGGDNSITFASFLALLNRVKDSKKVGFLQFDSHGDMNLYKTSPIKNFHGMHLRPFLDSFDIPNIRSLVHKKLPVQNIIFVGDLELDSEEKVFFNKMGFRNIDRSDVLDRFGFVLKELKKIVNSFDYIHVNFDIDVLSDIEVVATGIPSHKGKGFMFYELLPLLKIFSKHPNWSMDLSEVNPQKEGSKKTIDIAQKVLETLLGI